MTRLEFYARTHVDPSRPSHRSLVGCRPGAGACDEQRIAGLLVGVATGTEVRRPFGRPVTAVPQADGSRVVGYPRQPKGSTNHVSALGAGGRPAEARQVLTENRLAQVGRVTAPHEVRALLGRPARTLRVEVKGEEVWDWRFKTGPNGQDPRLFSVTFGADGRVASTATVEDPRETQIGGN